MRKQDIKKIIKKLNVSDPIIVNWVDAGDDEPPVTGLVWKSMKDSISSLRVIEVRSIGFFHCMKAKTLFLFNNTDTDPDDPQIANQAQIPLGCIESIEVLNRYE